VRFLVDECTGPVVARWLRERQHDVFSVYEEARGLDDDNIIQKAFLENRILITNDRDFGEKVFRERQPHKGVVFLRLHDDRAIKKVAALERLLANYADQLANRFIVVTEMTVRIVGRTKEELQ
jgi:predicted nuclease of predicted toxin-antitoxin system